jgi:hypothetical protein
MVMGSETLIKQDQRIALAQTVDQDPLHGFISGTYGGFLPPGRVSVLSVAAVKPVLQFNIASCCYT